MGKKPKYHPSHWPQSYTPAAHPTETKFRSRRAMQGPEKAAWFNCVPIEHAREVLGIAFDEFDALVGPPYDDFDDTAEVCDLIVKHGAAPDPDAL